MGAIIIQLELHFLNHEVSLSQSLTFEIIVIYRVYEPKISKCVNECEYSDNFYKF